MEARKIEDTFHRPHMCVRRNGRGNDGVLRWQLAERSAIMDGYICNTRILSWNLLVPWYHTI
jgi:hypothetical protein